MRDAVPARFLATNVMLTDINDMRCVPYNRRGVHSTPLASASYLAHYHHHPAGTGVDPACGVGKSPSFSPRWLVCAALSTSGGAAQPGLT